MTTINTLKGGVNPIPPLSFMNPPSITSISYTEPGATYKRPIFRGRVFVDNAVVTVYFSAGWPRTYTAIVNGNDWMFQKDVDMDPGQFGIEVLAKKTGYSNSMSNRKSFYILGNATGLPTIQLILQKKLVRISRPRKPIEPKEPKDTKSRESDRFRETYQRYLRDLKAYNKSRERMYEQMSIGWFTTNAWIVKLNGIEYSPFGLNVIISGELRSTGTEVSYNFNIEAVGPLGTVSVPCTFILRTIL